MQHGDGRAPVALTRDQPVAQAVGLGRAADPVRLELLDHAGDRVALAQAVQRARVDHAAVAGQRDARFDGIEVVDVAERIDRHAVGIQLDHGDRPGDGGVRVDDHPDGQVEGAREVEVALVVRRHGHDRTVTVVGQHVVGGPDRQLLAVDRVDRVVAQEHARLGAVGRLTLDVGRTLHLREVGLELLAHLGIGGCRELAGQFGLGRHDEERRAVQRVGAGREDRDLVGAALDLELDVSADGAADPVALHLDDLARPEALELVQVVEQAVGVVGDAQEPLRQLLLDDDGAAALRSAVGQHLLVASTVWSTGSQLTRASLR